MRIIVNATPFIALSAIEKLDLLPRLYEMVYVPEAVVEELGEGGDIFVPDLHKLSGYEYCLTVMI